MIDRSRLLTLASATTLTLAMAPALAEQPAAQPAAEASTAAPAATPDAARAAMEQRWADAMAERERRYQELRERAAEQGMELPETPPWAQAGMPEGMPPMPQMPEMPEGMPMMPEGMPEMPMMGRPAPMQAPMTPEERDAMRAERWEEMRARAAERGMELPETPPWEAAEQRRQAMLEKYNEYRSIIEAMTDEQKEAISALFGGQRAPMRSPMHGYGRPPVHPGMMPRGPMPGAPMPGAAEPEAAPQAETQPAG